jgi:tRNA-(ms[2]io[6]A)-hydroxylase
MLQLASATESRWVAAARADISTLLSDHANCEKKAASTAINLLFRYPDRIWLLRPLSELAREELEHFQLVLDELDARGLPYLRLPPSRYAGRLLAAVRPTEPDRIVDTLLCCALIEARSCERMKLLSTELEDPGLRSFYADLLATEARHFQLYIDLATIASDRESARLRLRELALHEASILTEPGDGLRMHSDA